MLSANSGDEGRRLEALEELCRTYCASHTRRGWFIKGAELARYGKRHTPLRQGRERAEHFGGGQRCGAGGLREPHLPLSMTLQAITSAS